MNGWWSHLYVSSPMTSQPFSTFLSRRIRRGRDSWFLLLLLFFYLNVTISVLCLLPFLFLFASRIPITACPCACRPSAPYWWHPGRTASPLLFLPVQMECAKFWPHLSGALIMQNHRQRFVSLTPSALIDKFMSFRFVEKKARYG